MSQTFYSQFNQDEIINTILGNKKNGFFIDIGAYDGITFSNSYFFEKTNHWRGVCFEPNPIVFKKLAAARNCMLVNGGVSVSNSELTFKRFSGNQELEMLSGFSDFFNAYQISRIETELTADSNSSTETIQIKTYSLNDFLKQHHITQVDYCSIDTEGGEFGILKTIDFDNCYFGSLSIEDNFDAKEVINYMESKGFAFQFIWKCDLFFINKKEPVSLSTKLRLSKYYLNYHLKKAKWIYKPLNVLYKTFVSEKL